MRHLDIRVEYIPEPHLEFGGHFLHPDKKTGLAEFGPFGLTDPALHPTQIKVGIVGTRATVELCERWVDECRGCIETDKRQKRRPAPVLGDEPFDEDAVVEALIKGLTPDFVGMSADSSFKTSVITADRWRSAFLDREAREIAEGKNAVQRVERATDLVADHIERLATTSPAPDVILVALPEVLLENSAVAPLSSGNWLNLRRGLKARSMKWGVPIQIIREDTLSGKRLVCKTVLRAPGISLLASISKQVVYRGEDMGLSRILATLGLLSTKPRMFMERRSSVAELLKHSTILVKVWCFVVSLLSGI